MAGRYQPSEMAEQARAAIATSALAAMDERGDGKGAENPTPRKRKNPAPISYKRMIFSAGFTYR